LFLQIPQHSRIVKIRELLDIFKICKIEIH